MLNRHIAAGLMVACIALATPPAARADEASHLKAAEQLLVESGTQQSLEKMSEQMSSAMAKSTPPRYMALIDAFYKKHFGWENIKADTAKIFVKNFTEEELNDMIAFYQSPTGKKSVTLMPKLLEEGVTMTQKRVAEHLPELQAQLAAERQKEEAEKKAKEPQPAPAPAPAETKAP